jgi:hypothetical protein
MKYRPYQLTSDHIKQVEMNGAGRTRTINQKYTHNLSQEPEGKRLLGILRCERKEKNYFGIQGFL